MGLTLKQPGNVPDAPYFDGAFRTDRRCCLAGEQPQPGKSVGQMQKKSKY